MRAFKLSFVAIWGNDLTGEFVQGLPQMHPYYVHFLQQKKGQVSLLVSYDQTGPSITVVHIESHKKKISYSHCVQNNEYFRLENENIVVLISSLRFLLSLS